MKNNHDFKAALDDLQRMENQEIFIEDFLERYIPTIQKSLGIAIQLEAHKEALSELVKAGDRANQESWHVVGLPWNNAAPYINTGSPDPHIGVAIIDTIEIDYFEGYDDEDIENQRNKIGAENMTNLAFVELAANTRPILKQILKEME